MGGFPLQRTHDDVRAISLQPEEGESLGQYRLHSSFGVKTMNGGE